MESLNNNTPGNNLPVLGAFVISSLAALGFGFFWRNTTSLGPVFAHSAYYFLWASVLLYLSYFDWGQKNLGTRITEHLKQNCWPYLGAFILTGFIFLALGVQYRVLADETNLISTSLSLYLNKSLYNITEGNYFYDTLHVVRQEQVLRPALYPFLVHLLHTILGYRPENGFLLNFLVGFASFATLYHFVQKHAQRSLAWTSMILLAAIPIFSMSITSAGFDAINLLFFQLVCFQIFEFMLYPSGIKLEKVFSVVLLASQCRYESVLLILPLALSALYHRSIISLQNFSWRLPLVPLLFLPIAWQRIIGKNELHNGGDFTEHPFSLAYVPEHLKNFLEFLFNPQFDNLPGPQLIAILATIGVIEFFFRTSLKDQRKRKIYLTGFLIILTFAATSLVHLSYYLADIRQAFIMRISNVYSSAIAIMAAYTLYLLAHKIKKQTLAPCLALVLFFYYLPVASINERGTSLILFREYRHNLKFLSSFARETTLIINDRPGMYITHYRGAVSFEHANNNSSEVLNNLKRHLFQNIVVIQNIRYQDKMPTFKLNDDYVLEPIYEYQNAADNFVRISKVVLSNAE